MTQLTVLGADGGIADGSRTSCFLIDDDILIDAGTGLGDLSAEGMAKIDEVFLSHVHMDHIACLPLMIDTVIALREQPVTVHAPATDHEKLLDHVFNDVIWPDFTCIPTPDVPPLRVMGQSPLPLARGNRMIGTLPVDHHGEAVGYWIKGGAGTLAITCDTGPCDVLWTALNALDNLTHLIVECSFPDELENLALNTGHLSPSLLMAELAQLTHAPKILVSHLKPVFAARIREEISALLAGQDVSFIERGQTLVF